MAMHRCLVGSHHLGLEWIRDAGRFDERRCERAYESWGPSSFSDKTIRQRAALDMLMMGLVLGRKWIYR